MLSRSWFVIAALGVMTLPLAACETEGRQESAAQQVPGGSDAVVTLANFAFSPSTVEVMEGETVAWVWDDGSVVHDVVFDSGPASPQQSEGKWEHQFGRSGTYDYICTIHPQMAGTVVVS